MKNSMTTKTGPLAGLRVLELGEMVAAPYCAKLLGDLGAEVIKIEKPEGGDAARWRGPFLDDALDPERSGSFLYLNTSKRSVCLDVETGAGSRDFARLASSVDILIEDRAPGTLDRLGVGYEALATRNPGLIMTSITPFGQTGPYAGHTSHHLNLYHSSGHASPFALVGADDRHPSRAGGYLGEYDAGLTAALGTLGAVLGRAKNGRGEHIDCSKQEAMMCLERVTIGRYANETDPFAASRGPGGLSRTKDGWVMLTTLEQHQWDGLVRAMGNPEWAHAEWCETPQGRMEHFDEIAARKDEWGANLSAEDIYHAAQAEGTPAAPVRSVEDVLDWSQPRERGFFAEVEHPRAGMLTIPTAPYQMTESSWVGTRAPLLGEHTEEILSRSISAPSSPPVEKPKKPARPLEGIRIIDFTWAWAGPQSSLLLGMLGAEVIKVESQARLDHARVHSLTAGSMQGGIDESPVFNDLNLGKRSVTLNLQTEGGRDLVKKLVAGADIVLQNMRPGVLDKLGLGYDSLRTVRPDLIMASSSAVGATGPEGRYAGYAPTFACLSGIASLSGHPDEPPISLSGSVDLRVGTACAFAVLAALYHRDHTGLGQHIDLSSTEVMSAMMGHAFLDYQLSGVVPQRIGNRDDQMAPHGCYRCRDDGEWADSVSIAVADDQEWAALRGILKDDQLGGDDYATAIARKRNEDALDERIEAWTREHSVDEIVETLQNAGIAATRMQSGASLAKDPHVRARDVYVPIHHPHLGDIEVVRPPWRMRGAELSEPAPLLGQHNDYVLGEILGFGADEIEALVEDRVVY